MINLTIYRVEAISTQNGDLIVNDELYLINGGLRGVPNLNLKPLDPAVWLPQNTTPKLTHTYRQNSNSLTLQYTPNFRLQLYVNST